jgi:hypothetical protein
MTNAAAPAPLLRRIRALSQTTRPHFIGISDPDNLEATMRADAERRFQHALLVRTFWNLTSEERDHIRQDVFAEHPEYSHSMYGPSFDLDCLREIARLLEQSRDDR